MSENSPHTPQVELTRGVTPTYSDELEEDANLTPEEAREAQKKKNAKAQAAFRARRADYIATLEETVTNLENVVLQLQDSIQEKKDEALIYEQAYFDLREQFKKREKCWRKLWKAKLASQDANPDNPSHGTTASLPVSGNSTSAHQPPHNYETATATSYSHADTSMAHNNSYVYYNASTSSRTGEGSTSSSYQVSRFSPYPYPGHMVQQNNSWSSATSPHFIDLESTTTHGESIHPSNPCPADDRSYLASLNAAPYMFSTDTDNSIPNHNYNRQEAFYGGATNESIHLPANMDAPHDRSISSPPETEPHNLPALPRLGTALQEDDHGPQARESSPEALPTGTLDVIQAQTLGRKRRARIRNKTKTSKRITARVVKGVLAVSGIGMEG